MANHGLCELCQKRPSSERYMLVNLCPACYNTIVTAWNGNFDSINSVLNPAQFPNPTDNAKNYLIEAIRIRSRNFETQRAEKERRKAEEAQQAALQQRLDEEYRQAKEAEESRLLADLKKINDLYEYDVVVISNTTDGAVNELQIANAIKAHARLGWRLHTIYSNEIGKNSNSYGGYGTNATICQDVLIFERRIHSRG